MLPTLLVCLTPLAVAPDDVLVTVDGQAITEADLEFEFITAGVPEEKRDAVRKRYLDGLVEARLLAGFLNSRKVEAAPELVDEQVNRIRRMIARRDLDPDEVLKRVGYDDATLRRKLELPIAWETYAQQVVRPADVRRFWEQHRTRFDGTRVRARQILLRLPADAAEAAVAEATQLLASIRQQVADGKIDFADAAKEHSQAPTGRSGGDVGWFPYRGKMPVTFTSHVFGLKQDELTQPFRSPFGVHLVQVTDITPGEYSLEDVRTFVVDALTDEVRSGLIEKERATAKVVWAKDE